MNIQLSYIAHTRRIAPARSSKWIFLRFHSIRHLSITRQRTIVQRFASHLQNSLTLNSQSKIAHKTIATAQI